ncbi:MAG: hypothetical protein QW692_00535 [Nitrososphaerota archaeon]
MSWEKVKREIEAADKIIDKVLDRLVRIDEERQAIEREIKVARYHFESAVGAVAEIAQVKELMREGGRRK